MSLRRIHLRKVLKLLSISNGELITELRADIRNEIDKLQRDEQAGSDFHVPFWSDAKLHAAGRIDLTDATFARIDSNRARKRLYPLLTEGFLRWWSEFGRTTNQPISVLEDHLTGIYQIPKANALVKVSNVLALRVGSTTRVVYPYFSERPELSNGVARIGLWIMSQSLPQEDERSMVLLDVLRGREFTFKSHPLRGDEGERFQARYEAILKTWVDLAARDYDWAA